MLFFFITKTSGYKKTSVIGKQKLKTDFAANKVEVSISTLFHARVVWRTLNIWGTEGNISGNKQLFK